MYDFNADILAREQKMKDLASTAVQMALDAGADECVVAAGCAQGISVSSRSGEVENIEFNRDNGMSITVYKDHRKGSASTTDLSAEALQQTASSAVSLASFADPDECAGLPDKDRLCTNFKDWHTLYEGFKSPDDAVALAVKLDKLGIEDKSVGLKNSDGASVDYAFYNQCMANSLGFCRVSSSSMSSASLTLLGESEGKMQRGSGFTVARSPSALYAPERVEEEARVKTLNKLNAVTVKTGKYNVIFSRSAVQSLMGHITAAISGGHIYRRSSFLCDSLGQQILPSYVTLHEDPFIDGAFGSKNCDSEGVAVTKADLIHEGILNEYLLSSYSARKLKMQTNGHAGGTHNLFVNFDAEHTKSFDELLADAGEGIVIEELMGQGVDLTSGNYSRGAAGFYFKNGKREYAVSEITVAGNLKDMFMRMALIGDDRDLRYRMQTGSVLIPDMTISGS